MKRIEWIDNAKAITCFLVILGHLLMSLRSIYDNEFIEYIIFFIYLFHMPLFLCLSGILYFKKKEKFTLQSYKNFEINKIINLIVPYFTFYTIFILLSEMAGSSTNTSRGVKEWFSIINNPLPPYWFLYALLAIFIIVPIIELICKYNKKKIFSFFFLLRILLVFIKPKLYFISVVMCWGMFFCIGAFAKLDSEKVVSNKIVLGLIFYILSSLVYFKYSNLLNNIINELINIIFELFGVILFLKILQKINKLKILNFYKNYTFQIFLTHTIFAAAIRILLFKLNINNYFIHFILGMVVSVYLPVVMSKISEKIRYTQFFFYPIKTIKELKGEC